MRRTAVQYRELEATNSVSTLGLRTERKSGTGHPSSGGLFSGVPVNSDAVIVLMMPIPTQKDLVIKVGSLFSLAMELLSPKNMISKIRTRDKQESGQVKHYFLQEDSSEAPSLLFKCSGWSIFFMACTNGV